MIIQKGLITKECLPQKLVLPFKRILEIPAQHNSLIVLPEDWDDSQSPVTSSPPEGDLY